jgi:hypothetical protein
LPSSLRQARERYRRSTPGPVTMRERKCRVVSGNFYMKSKFSKYMESAHWR